MPKKVNLIHLTDEPGGIEVLLPLIINHIPDKTFTAFIIRDPKNVKSVYANLDIPLLRGSNNNLLSYLKTFLYAFRRRNEVFHAFNIGPIYLILLRLAGVRHILYSIHGTIYWKNEKYKRLVQWIWKMALDPKIKMTANSVFSKNEFMRKINDKVTIEVLGNPIDTDRFFPEDKPHHRKNIHIAYVGRLEKGKNLLKWIDVAEQVHQELPETQFFLYGRGSLLEEIQKKINNASATNYIHLMGFTPFVEKAYRDADVVLFLSEYESFGNVIVESILCGTPVIVSPIPAMKEIFSNYPEFILAEKEEWGSQVVRKVRDLSTLNKVTLQAREELSARYSTDHHIHVLRRLYAELIGKIVEDANRPDAGTSVQESYA